MASKQSTVDYILEQIAEAGDVSAKKMFGEYGIYCNGKIIGSVCDDQLFIKPTQEAKDFIGDYVEGVPYPGAKPFLSIPGEEWENSQWLTQLIKISEKYLPASKPKKGKVTNKKSCDKPTIHDFYLMV